MGGFYKKAEGRRDPIDGLFELPKKVIRYVIEFPWEEPYFEKRDKYREPLA